MVRWELWDDRRLNPACHALRACCGRQLHARECTRCTAARPGELDTARAWQRWSCSRSGPARAGAGAGSSGCTIPSLLARRAAACDATSANLATASGATTTALATVATSTDANAQGPVASTTVALSTAFTAATLSSASIACTTSTTDHVRQSMRRCHVRGRLSWSQLHPACKPRMHMLRLLLQHGCPTARLRVRVQCCTKWAV